MKYCTRCWAELVDDAVVCTTCGCRVEQVVVKTSEIRKRFIDRRSIIVIFIILLLLIILQTVIAYLIIPKPIDEETLAEKRILDSLRIVSENAMKMGATTEDTPIEITVHIAGMEDHFLKASVIFEYDEKNEKLGTELRKRASTKYKDMLKKHMSNLSFTEITDPSERDKICNDLQHIINASLPKNMGEIRSVMFTNYITQ